MSQIRGALAAVTAIMLVAGPGSAAFADPVVPPPDASYDPAMLAALKRDLNLDSSVFARDRHAADAEPGLRTSLGAAFGGLWIDGEGFTVGVTDAGLAGTVRAAGGRARVVAHSAAELDRVKAALDRAGAGRAQGVTGWGVDPRTNSVLVTAVTADAATDLVAAAGVTGGPVRVEVDARKPTPTYPVRGGDHYLDWIANSNSVGVCSVGFSVIGGFVTAGHCTHTGEMTTGYNDVDQGVVRASVTSGTDASWVQTNAMWTPQALVNNHNGGTVAVTGSQDAAVGAAVCRSGRTSGWHCGKILSRGYTTRTDDYTWNNQIKTDVCANGGDSGGALVAGTQGQGTTSASWAECGQDDPASSYQPLSQILDMYGLTLVTSAPPQVPLAGDWNGDGKDTIAIWRPNEHKFYLRNSLSSGGADVTLTFGQADDVPVAGDWNGDGVDTVGVWRPSENAFYLRATNDPANGATTTLDLADTNQLPLIGDWTGDGKDDVGRSRYSNHQHYLYRSGQTTIEINFGQLGDVPLSGDWDKNGVDSIGLFRPGNNTWYRKYNNDPADSGTHTPLAFGQMRDLPIAGDWNGDGMDTVGVYRNTNKTFYLYNESGSTTQFVYG
ncbi:S1 family peptidase [Paractinoplanes toevensis]|uniref:Peptidase S1A alpha-lytic prodomain domain-containing protein n=1 Tax=Paractinoplanes toevensis TaxID=571911 RepID=A0A919TCZ7_9ACTN|nr:S1 family peptidase [Actinoplanes toevensis]GIM91826.1 hypothetical protein Ato02nite_036190 [Actinoplanes toevensis]